MGTRAWYRARLVVAGASLALDQAGRVWLVAHGEAESWWSVVFSAGVAAGALLVAYAAGWSHGATAMLAFQAGRVPPRPWWRRRRAQP